MRRKRCVSDFLCEECFGILATLFGSILILLFIGIILFSFGFPMKYFYALVMTGFVISLLYSLKCVRKRRMMKKRDDLEHHYTGT